MGNFKMDGQKYRVEVGNPLEVKAYEISDKELGKTIPSGADDIQQNEGWVTVGQDHDTVRFAVKGISWWWFHMGTITYPNAAELLITADIDCGHGSLNRIWKKELQKFFNEIGIPVTVVHFPQRTSKLSKIEHQMFSRISMN